MKQAEMKKTTLFPTSISLGELLKMDLPVREHLIAPWLREGESAMVFAAPGVGKSMFALALALAVAGGGTLLNRWQAPKPRNVLYVDGEMPLDDIRSRVQAMTDAAKGSPETIHANLAFLSRQQQAQGIRFVDLAEEESREDLIRQAKEKEVSLIILDNLTTLATLHDENDAACFNAPIAFLLRLKQEGIACLLVHHSNKNGKHYRGSSKIATTFEVILGLERLDTPSKGAGVTSFRLNWEKYRGKRDESIGTPLDVTLGEEVCQDGQVKVEWQAEQSEDQRLDVLLETLRSGEYITQKELVVALPWPCSEATLTRLKARALGKGMITEGEWKGCFARAKAARACIAASEGVEGMSSSFPTEADAGGDF